MALRITKKTGRIARGVAAVRGRWRSGAAIASTATTTRPTSRSPARRCRPATEAALAETGGGQVTETEVDDEESKYEVEVTLDDGSQVDVQLDEAFHVVGTEAEDARTTPRERGH